MWVEDMNGGKATGLITLILMYGFLQTQCGMWQCGSTHQLSVAEPPQISAPAGAQRGTMRSGEWDVGFGHLSATT